VAERFSAGWLALREHFDNAARTPELIAQFVALLPPMPLLIDVGAGAGSLFRMLAPVIGGTQSWVFADQDGELLAHGMRRVAQWAAVYGLPTETRDGTLRIHGPQGTWNVAALALADSRNPKLLRLSDADAVVCSALLDLVSGRWLREFVHEAAGRPVYAGMTIDGRDRWLPAHASDAVVRRAFARHLHRHKGTGPGLGTDAPFAAMHAFQTAGYRTRSAPADWRIPPHASGMLRALIGGRAAAAAEADPARRRRIAGWAGDRLNQVVAGRLAIRIGHRDILAW
jgi:hypothetical protein